MLKEEKKEPTISYSLGVNKPYSKSHLLFCTTTNRWMYSERRQSLVEYIVKDSSHLVLIERWPTPVALFKLSFS